MAADHLATTCRRAGALALLVLIGLLVLSPGPAAAAGPGRAQAAVGQVEGARGKPGKAVKPPAPTTLGTAAKDKDTATRKPAGRPRPRATAAPTGGPKAEEAKKPTGPRATAPPKGKPPAKSTTAPQSEPTAKVTTPPKEKGQDQGEDSGKGGPPVRTDGEEPRPEVDRRQDEDRVEAASPSKAGDGKAAVPPALGTAVEPSAPPEPSPPAPPEPDAADRTDQGAADSDDAAAPAEPDEEGVLSASLNQAPPADRAPANASVVQDTAPAAAPAAPSTSGPGEPALRPSGADGEMTAAAARSLPPELGTGAAEVVDKLSGTTRALGQAAQEHSGVAATTVAIAALIAAYLFVQGHVDRRDPKLAHAPYDDDLTFE